MKTDLGKSLLDNAVYAVEENYSSIALFFTTTRFHEEGDNPRSKEDLLFDWMVDMECLIREEL